MNLERAYMDVVPALQKPSPAKVVRLSREEPQEVKLLNESDFHFLHEMAIRIFSPDPLPEILEGVIEFVSAVVQCDSCFIYVLEEDTLLLRASKNPHPDITDHLRLKLGQGITGWVAAHKRPVCIGQNAYGDPRFKVFNQLPEDRFESFLSVPIVSHCRVVGVINLQNRAIHNYHPSEVQIISTIGLLVGAAVEIAVLEAKASQLSDQLATRKLVERAKSVLQRDLGITEESAYTALQQESCRKRKPMRELAEAILFSEDFKRSLKT